MCQIAGHELLHEMSHAELKERLFFMREANMIEQQKKRDCILEEKQKKHQLLLEEIDNINFHNEVMEMATTFRSAKFDALTEPPHLKRHILRKSGHT